MSVIVLLDINQCQVGSYQSTWKLISTEIYFHFHLVSDNEMVLGAGESASCQFLFLEEGVY